MMQSPLLLNTYFFPIINIVANPGWEPVSAEGKNAPSLTCNFNTVKIKNTDNQYEVTLTLGIVDTLDNPSQYNVNLVAVGILTLTADHPQPDQFVTLSGASILYSASREMLLQLMGRGPYPPIMLSPMIFGMPQTQVEEAPKK